MSFELPLFDIARDAIRPFTSRSYLILTDQNVPVRVFPYPHFGSKFHIYTTALNVCSEFGARSQHEEGYMCHGMTKIPVKVPYVGQEIFFWTNYRRESKYSCHRVRRIYDRPIIKILEDPWSYLNGLLVSLDISDSDIMKLNVTTKVKNSYDEFFKSVLVAGINHINTNSWAFDQKMSQSILQSIPKYVQDQNPIFHSGLLWEGDRVQVSEVLYILLMEALHKALPMKSQFDRDGILRLA